MSSLSIARRFCHRSFLWALGTYRLESYQQSYIQNVVPALVLAYVCTGTHKAENAWYKYEASCGPGSADSAGQKQAFDDAPWPLIRQNLPGTSLYILELRHYFSSCRFSAWKARSMTRYITGAVYPGVVENHISNDSPIIRAKSEGI
jgi:hypothetical protein